MVVEENQESISVVTFCSKLEHNTFYAVLHKTFPKHFYNTHKKEQF